MESIIKPGNKVKVFYSNGNINNSLIHIRAIVDGRIVCKKWLKGKQRWYYFVEDMYYFEIRKEYIKLVGKS